MQITTLSIADSNSAQQNQVEHQLFIGGCSRSGTTLLGAMLGAHPDLICTPESHFKIEILRQLWPLSSPIDPLPILRRLTKHWRYKLWGVEDTPEELVTGINGRFYGDILNGITWAYARNQAKPSAKWWVDHTPENISYAHALLTIYPNAKFVHIVRDGRAVAASIMPLDWGPNSIIKAARWWVRMTSFGLAAESDLSSEQIIRVRYEELVQNPAAVMQTLCDFLGITYHEQMLHATGFTPPAYTTQQHQLVGHKPDIAALDKWKQKLTPRQIELFEHQARDFLQHLDYLPEYGLGAKGPSFVETQLGKAQELIRGELINKIKWLVRSYPLWLTRDFYSFAKLSDSNN